MTEPEKLGPLRIAGLVLAMIGLLLILAVLGWVLWWAGAAVIVVLAAEAFWRYITNMRR